MQKIIDTFINRPSLIIVFAFVGLLGSFLAGVELAYGSGDMALINVFLVAICAVIFTLSVKEACKKEKGAGNKKLKTF